MEQVKKLSVVDLVVKALLKEFHDSAWQPGTQLPSERELAEQLGVSRNALREALKQLQFMGMISIRHGEGVFVNALDHTAFFKHLGTLIQLDSTAIDELIEARIAIESTTSRLSATRATADDLEAIEMYTGMSNSESDAAEFSRTDTSFHLAIAEAAHNRVLLHLFRHIQGALAEQQELIAAIPGIQRISADYHRRIFEAIKAKDGTEASLLITEHIGNVLKRLREQEAPDGGRQQ